MIGIFKVALCDDSPILRGRLEELIRSYEAERGVPFEYFLFESGEELLEKFEQDKALADIYFLDYFMKVLNGVQTAQQIRKYNSNCDIVFVTSTDYLYEFMEVSPLKILSKPAKKEDVFSVLDMALAKRGHSEDSMSGKTR